MADFKLKAGVLAIGAALMSPLAAQAAVEGPSGMDFYDVPFVSTASNGDLIWYREASVDLGSGAPLAEAYNVMYRSTDSLGAQNVVTGTVLVSSNEWTGSGERPTLSYAVGTHGLDQSCAPSMQLQAGTDYEIQNIRALSRKVTRFW